MGGAIAEAEAGRVWGQGGQASWAKGQSRGAMGEERRGGLGGLAECGEALGAGRWGEAQLTPSPGLLLLQLHGTQPLPQPGQPPRLSEP